ncbi:MAG: cupin domain-containing protein [Bacteroidales bacterium]|nr:cupin domain-containing protein [Bacteroidales bacterium]
MEKKEFEKSKVFNVIESIEFADDAIVSKTILNKETGTVTLFAFDKGQSLSEHTAPFDALIQVTDGIAEIIINKIVYKMTSGEMIIMPAAVPHAVKAVHKFKMILTMIKK